MSTKKKRVLWIDDEPGRERDANNICDAELQIKFISKNIDALKPNEMAKYDLILVDYRLNKLAKPLKGPAIVGLLRSVDDETPAYLVSSESLSKRSQFSGLTWFEEALSLSDVQDLPQIRKKLKADIDGYRAIRSIRRGANAENAIASLLKVPEIARSSVIEAIPASVKASLVRNDNSPQASGTAEISGRLGFARWVRRVLLQKPGPLLPILHAATRVGMKPVRLQRIHRFRDCIYTGIFADLEEPRWWAPCLDDLIFAEQRKKDLKGSLPWEIGPELFHLTKRDQPKCVVCGEFQPDTVARDVDDPSREAAVHQRHSIPDPGRDFTPFFIEERLFKEKEED